MSNFYKQPRYAWDWVIILHRLAAKADDVPIKLVPSKSAVALRMKIFGGRQYIEERPLDCKTFGRYNLTSKETRIKNLAGALTIHKLEGFSYEYYHIRPDNFTQVLQQLHSYTSSGRPNTTLGGFEPLNTIQVESLREYIKSAFDPFSLIITPQSISISLRPADQPAI